MNVVVVGCGYVGLVSGVSFASLGHNVLGIEIDERRADLIRSGKPPFHEPGLAEKLQASLAEGTFHVTSRIEEAVDGDVVFLCVQTPSSPDGALNTEFLVSAARQLGIAFSESDRRRVVVVRSTVVPGTTEGVVGPAIHEQSPDTAVAANPEFLREGSAVRDFLEPDRVVIGCREDWAAEQVADLYAPLNPLIIRTTPAVAELAKCTSNALLATLISFSNEIARIAESIPGVDAEEVLNIIHEDRRLSPGVNGQKISPEILSYLKPGSGFGGSCLPKDLRALINYATSVGEPASLLQSVKDINDTQPSRVVAMTKDALGGLEGRMVSILGLAFKAGTDDLRESPGLKMLDLFLEEGARVSAFDPLVPRSALEGLEGRGVTIAETLSAAIHETEACIVATRADEFRQIRELLLSTGKEPPVVIDARRLLDPNTFNEERFGAVGLGRQLTR